MLNNLSPNRIGYFFQTNQRKMLLMPLPNHSHWLLSNTTAQDSAIFLGVNLDDILSLKLQVGLINKGPNKAKSMFVYRPVSKLNNIHLAKFTAQKLEPKIENHISYSIKISIIGLLPQKLWCYGTPCSSIWLGMLGHSIHRN